MLDHQRVAAPRAGRRRHPPEPWRRAPPAPPPAPHRRRSLALRARIAPPARVALAAVATRGGVGRRGSGRRL